MNFRGMYGTEYEQRAAAANTSEEVVFAIEQICDGEIDDEDSDAYALWANGGRDAEILAALPVGCGEEDGDTLFWGDDEFAEFRDGKWVLLA